MARSRDFCQLPSKLLTKVTTKLAAVNATLIRSHASGTIQSTSTAQSVLKQLGHIIDPLAAIIQGSHVSEELFDFTGLKAELKALLSTVSITFNAMFLNTFLPAMISRLRIEIVRLIGIERASKKQS